MVFMVNLEIPVVVTALVAITNDLSGFNDLSWVISSYLLGYVGQKVHPEPVLFSFSSACILTAIFARSCYRDICQVQ
jgi:hypothetical protein